MGTYSNVNAFIVTIRPHSAVFRYDYIPHLRMYRSQMLNGRKLCTL